MKPIWNILSTKQYDMVPAYFNPMQNKRIHPPEFQVIAENDEPVNSIDAMQTVENMVAKCVNAYLENQSALEGFEIFICRRENLQVYSITIAPEGYVWAPVEGVPEYKNLMVT